MRKLLSALLLLTAFGWAKPVEVLEGKLTLDVPQGFVELSPQDIGRKFPPQRPPKVAFANNREHMGVTVAVTLSQTRVQPEKLKDFGLFLERSLAAQGKVESGGLVEINHQSWYRIVLQSEALDQPVRNEILVSPLGSEVIMINLTSTVAEYPTFQRALQGTRQSLLLAK